MFIFCRLGVALISAAMGKAQNIIKKIMEITHQNEKLTSRFKWLYVV